MSVRQYKTADALDEYRESLKKPRTRKEILASIKLRNEMDHANGLTRSRDEFGRLVMDVRNVPETAIEAKMDGCASYVADAYLRLRLAPLVSDR